MKSIVCVLSFVMMLFFVIVCPVAAKDADINPDGYDVLFNHAHVHDIEIVISREEWNGLIQDMREYAEEDWLGLGRTGNYRKAMFVYTGPAGDAVVEEVGFRTKGNISRIIPQDDEGNFHRAHFKVKFDKTFDLEKGTDAYEQRDERRFCALKALVFRMPYASPTWDVSQMRELYCYDLINRAGAYAAKTGSARLTITIEGEKKYFGIYTLMEPVDKLFLTKRYGKDKNDGNLYKCLFGDSGPATLQPVEERETNFWMQNYFPEDRVIGVKDWETHYRPTYDLKTNEDEEDHTELVRFIDSLNALSGDALQEYLDKNFEIDRFIRYQAMNVLLGKWDDYWTLGNNYYLYFNNDGKIEFITADYDMALGQGPRLFYSASTGIYEWSNHVHEFLALQSFIPAPFLQSVLDYRSPLVEKIFEIDAYRARYEMYLQEFVMPENRLFLYSDYEQRRSALQELYRPYLANDTGEGETVRNDESVGLYFFERTQSLINELGLEQDDYETKPAYLPAPDEIAASHQRYKNMITVTWNPVLFADYYRVYRAAAVSGSYERIGGDVVEERLNDQSVAVNSTYYYRVKAFTHDGIESAYSGETEGSTNDGSIQPPAGVTATDGMYSHMTTVSWEPVLNADYYRVYRSGLPDGGYDQLGGKTVETAFDDTSAAADTTYYYRVTACTEDGAETALSSTDAGYAHDDGLGPPDVLHAAALESGTYVHAFDNGIKTYTFNGDHTCTVVQPTELGNALISAGQPTERGNVLISAGQWLYDEEQKVLTIDTTAALVGGLVEIHLIETWENAFTLYGGSVLNLMGFKKVTGDHNGILGIYEGGGSISVLTGVGLDNQTIAITAACTLNEDDSWDWLTAVDTNGEVETGSETATGYANRLIEYGGSYYLTVPVESFFYYRAECPLEMSITEKDLIDTLRRIRDVRLTGSEGHHLVHLYYVHAREISSLLLRNGRLQATLTGLLAENMDTARQYVDTGGILLQQNDIQNVLDFFLELKKGSSAGLQKDIDSVIAKIKAGDMLRAMGVRVR